MEEKGNVTHIQHSYGPVNGHVMKQQIITLSRSEQSTGNSDSGDAVKGAAVKVRARVLLELMKRSGIGLDLKERTKVCRLAALVMGCDYKSLLNTVGEGIRLNSKTHRSDVEEANRLLSELEADFSLDFD